MPTIERSEQAEDPTKDEKGSPSSDEPNSSEAKTTPIKQSKKVAVKKKTARKKAVKTAGSRMDSAAKKTPQTRRKAIQSAEPKNSDAETTPIKQSKKVAVKKKTTRKKAAKKAGGRMDSATKKTSQTRRKAMQTERPSGADQAASLVTGSETGKAPPAEQNQPEKPVESTASPAAAPPPSQPRPQGGTGLMGFWIKAGAAAVVILAGVIGIYSFFSEDEDTSRPQATQAAASVQGDDASVADSVATEPETSRRVVFPPTTEHSNTLDPAPSQQYRNEPGTFAGAAVVNNPAVESAVTTGVTPGIAPAADQARASQRDAAAPHPHSGHFAEKPAGYRPELYRPLEPKQDPPKTHSNAVNEAPRAASVPAPAYYPQPGAYAYPPAPHYGGSGRYYPY